MTPAERVAEAREKLVEAISRGRLNASMLGMRASMEPDEAACVHEIDTFAAACVAEAFEEMRVEAERRFEVNAAEPGFGPSAQAIAYGRLADWAKQQIKKGREGR